MKSGAVHTFASFMQRDSTWRVREARELCCFAMHDHGCVRGGGGRLLHEAAYIRAVHAILALGRSPPYSRFPDHRFFRGPPGMRSIHLYKCHGLETGSMGATVARFAWSEATPHLISFSTYKIWPVVLFCFSLLVFCKGAERPVEVLPGDQRSNPRRGPHATKTMRG